MELNNAALSASVALGPAAAFRLVPNCMLVMRPPRENMKVPVGWSPNGFVTLPETTSLVSLLVTFQTPTTTDDASSARTRDGAMSTADRARTAAMRDVMVISIDGTKPCWDTATIDRLD